MAFIRGQPSSGTTPLPDFQGLDPHPPTGELQEHHALIRTQGEGEEARAGGSEADLLDRLTLQDQQVVTASRRVTETADHMYERTVALDLLGERRRILESLQKRGSLVLDSAPEDLSVNVVNRYLELKARQVL